jgi:hypothetical protein
MKDAARWIVGGMLCLGLAGQAMALGFLDDMIYSVKCSGAEDKDACKAKAKQDFEDYQQRKQGGGAVTANATSPPSSPEKCQTVSGNGPTDVDTAYARAVGNFRFQSYEAKTHHGQYKVVTDSGYKHVRTPGALYDLWDLLRLTWPARNKVVTFYGGAMLSKNGTGSTVTARYCLSPADPEYGDPAFWQFADESFRKLVQ